MDPSPARSRRTLLERPSTLYLIVAVFAAIIVALLILGQERAMVLSDVRAYVGGEALYSKAQKRAVIRLLRYARSREERDYLGFLEDLRVPLGDRDARIELSKPDPDFGKGAEGLRRGRNHPEDVERMARFFVRFQNVTYVAEAIRIWTEGDREVARLQALGEALHDLVIKGAATPKAVDALLAEVTAVDDRLTALEDNFSMTLAEGARFLVRLTERLLLGVAFLLVVLGLFVSSRVIRAYRAAVGSVRKSEARYKALNDTMIDGMLILQQGKFVHVNPAAARLLDYAQEDLLGNDFADLIHPDFRAIVSERHKRRTAGESLPPRYDIQVLSRTGKALWVQIANERVDWEGKPAVLTIISDIGERKRAEGEVLRLNDELEARVQARTAELQWAYKQMESFSYSISHDLRAPLRAINGFADILRRDHAGSLEDKAGSMLERISANALRMSEMVDGLLRFGRLGQDSVRTMPVDMEWLARSAADELLEQPQWAHAEVRIGSLPPVTGDEMMLRQVWTNLISNALKFSASREAPVVDIAGSMNEGEASYCVSDNGVGFDPEFAHKLFGVFQRLHEEKAFPGTGIGLALVRRIVERHRGRTWAEGMPGAGARFHFAMPAAAGESQAAGLSPA